MKTVGLPPVDRRNPASNNGFYTAVRLRPKAVATMHVISLLMELELPSTSLKGKRGIVKSVLARARNRFNVAAAEVGSQDDRGTALVAFVAVSGDRAYARRLLEQLEEWLVDERPDLVVHFADYEER